MLLRKIVKRVKARKENTKNHVIRLDELHNIHGDTNEARISD